jgi:hypothetical protein
LQKGVAAEDDIDVNQEVFAKCIDEFVEARAKLKESKRNRATTRSAVSYSARSPAAGCGACIGAAAGATVGGLVGTCPVVPPPVAAAQ